MKVKFFIRNSGSGHVLIINIQYYFRFIGEEDRSAGNKHELSDAPTWVIDPIDGTMNFVHNNPNSCISVALFVNKSTQIGIVFNPTVGKFYTARLGQGAFCNGAAIRVSGETRIEKSLASTEFGPNRSSINAAIVLDNVNKVFRVAHG